MIEDNINISPRLEDEEETEVDIDEAEEKTDEKEDDEVEETDDEGGSWEE